VGRQVFAIEFNSGGGVWGGHFWWLRMAEKSTILTDSREQKSSVK
jgi:hypothetical protein